MKKSAWALGVLFVAMVFPARAQQRLRAEDFPALKPAFPGQTKAPAPQKAAVFTVETLVQRLSSP